MEEKFCYGCMREKRQSPYCEHCGHDERMQNEIHQLPIGTVLKGQYIIGKVLGQGGFGITYLGYNGYLNTPVAIKEYYPVGVVMREHVYTLEVSSCEGASGTQFEENRNRFLREAQSLARLNNVPEVVQVQDYFPENGTAYIVMEFVQGTTLKDHIRKHGLMDGKQLLEVFRPIMAGLQKVHDLGLVHRDISPDNIMMLPDGGVKLLDFGAVRDYGDKADQHSTQAILKPGFAPVEQYQSRGKLGPWTDVYALCATMYYCATGKVPPDSMGRLIEGLNLEWARVSGLTAGQVAALEKGMALQAGDRVQSVAELEELLFTTRVTSVTKSGGKEKKLSSLVPALLAVAAAVCVIFAGGLGSKNEPEPAEPVLAVQTEPEVTTQPTELPPETETPTETTEPIEDHSGTMLKRYQISTYSPDSSNPGERPMAFDLGIYRDEVSSITFLDTVKDAPDSAVDVSLNGTNGVLAWKNHNGQYYDIYIAAEGGVWANPVCDKLFYYYTNAHTINFNNAFFTDEVTIMSHMFYECNKLRKLDVSGFNTSRVTDMTTMFGYCEVLTELDVSGFDVSRVTGMSSMFSGCKALMKLDTSSWNTVAVRAMGNMFSFCQKLTAVDVSGFDTSNVEDLSGMFNYCDSLASVDVSGFDTTKVTNFDGMFQHCMKLQSVDVSGFDTSKCTNFSSMFYDTPLITNVDGSFDTGAATQAGNFMDSNDTFNGEPWRNIF